MQINFTDSQAGATLQAITIRCDSIKDIIRKCGEDAMFGDNINMEQMTLLTQQYNDLQYIMVSLVTSGASYC